MFIILPCMVVGFPDLVSAYDLKLTSYILCFSIITIHLCMLILRG